MWLTYYWHWWEILLLLPLADLFIPFGLYFMLNSVCIRLNWFEVWILYQYRRRCQINRSTYTFKCVGFYLFIYFLIYFPCSSQFYRNYTKFVRSLCVHSVVLSKSSFVFARTSTINHWKFTFRIYRKSMLKIG